jgi:uncharacterized protein (DUF302 family)
MVSMQHSNCDPMHMMQRKIARKVEKQMNEIICQIATDKSFGETVEAVEEQTPINGFRVLHTHHYQAILAGKALTRGPVENH